MESNITNQQFRSPGLPLAEPRFDEEATLLSARPVVPIERLTVKPNFSRRFSRPWIFGFALAGALLLGVSATTLYYSRFRTTQALPATSIETTSSGAQGDAWEAVAPPEFRIGATGAIVVGGTSVDSDTSTGVIAPRPAVSRMTKLPNSSRAVSKKPAHRHATVTDESSEREYESREERRAARREAKERKRANRERRAGRSADELLRIRDIFEGPPRP